MSYNIVDGGAAHVAAQSTDNTNVDTTGTPINTTGANLIVAFISAFSGHLPVMSDSNGNTWTYLPDCAATGTQCRIAYCESPIVGSGHTFSATDGTTSFPSITIQAWSGSTTGASDQQNLNTAGGTNSAQPGSVTPSEDNELIVTGLSSSDTGGAAVDSGFTISDQGQLVPASAFAIAMAYKVQTSLSAENPTWTYTSTNSGVVIATFKAGAVSAAIVIPGRMTIPVPGPRRTQIIQF